MEELGTYAKRIVSGRRALQNRYLGRNADYFDVLELRNLIEVKWPTTRS